MTGAETRKSFYSPDFIGNVNLFERFCQNDILGAVIRKTNAKHVYLHGSIVTQEIVEPNSDYDVSVVTERYKNLDLGGGYVSESFKRGRRVSMHISTKEFLLSNSSSAVEFRNKSNKKKTGRNVYMLPAVDKKSIPCEIHLICNQTKDSQYLISDIPQTGFYNIVGDKAFSGGFSYDVVGVFRVRGGEIYRQKPDEVFVWGLEAHKSLSKVVVHTNDYPQANMLRTYPLQRTLNLLATYVSSPMEASIAMLKTDKEYRRICSWRVKMSDRFIESLKPKFSQMLA